MKSTDQHTLALLTEAMQSVENYYQERGIFQERFGFGKKPAIVVVDFALGWTDENYAGGSSRLEEPVLNTSKLLDVCRKHRVPIIYTTSPHRPQSGDQPFKSAADDSPNFKSWDQRASRIDPRVAPQPEDLLIEKENASAFFGTHLISYLVEHGVDTLLITGCSTSACIRATATDAKSYRLRPMIVRQCVGDRSAEAHVWTLHDIQARFADVVSLEETIAYLEK